MSIVYPTKVCPKCGYELNFIKDKRTFKHGWIKDKYMCAMCDRLWDKDRIDKDPRFQPKEF